MASLVTPKGRSAPSAAATSWDRSTDPSLVHLVLGRGRRNEKKKLGVSNTPYDGGRWVTDGGWWVTDGGWCVTDGGWCVTDGGLWVTDGGWWVTDGGWWVATKHQRVDATVRKKTRVSVLMAPPGAW